MLKKEAEAGMTVVATIHQPSGEVFDLFDRLIVLQDGYTIYQGPVQELKNYFTKMGCQIGKFKNPADYIIKMA